ncbi:TlpA family protein disulfide reductase [Chryseobacterium indologenes]|uniref:TlpA family protein disulfide reductase n=1 Tax=Chryseobacterium indologenes TaxID=253 RepID=UPI0003E065CC|nr:TlpA disulfide reductase family protein [Chryseobacterium indologenes]QPQ50889.1 TlpA family protein disulfide reductase [Chryseobacterium indologenes]GAE63323.1 hypothetical protein CIN01S_03_01510 [Chryseobacterium indologenes NBRC 14944]SFJ13524.1 Thiol-disulfide isomerase or thioredoxin [Chryseobacterium indologenes]SUX49206.1 Stage IV sporulation protein H [Chryseobacterium indologenes]
MENMKKWLRANWSTALLMVVFIILLVNKDAKAWLMRQVASTGLLNSSFSGSKDKNKKITSVENMNLSLKKDDGSVINTAGLKGKVVFINFWASWCPPCRAEFPSIQEFYDQYKSNPDMVFLTVNLDDDSELGKVYMKQKNFTLPFVIPAGHIPTPYFSGSLPTTVVLDKKGKVQLHHQGLADYSKESFYHEIDALLSETN